MPCAGCQILPRIPAASGTLYLAPALAHTAVRLRERLSASEIDFAEPAPGLLALAVGPDGLDAVVERAAVCLSDPELEACRAVLVPDGVAFGLAQLQETRPLRAFAAQAGARWLRDAIEHESLTTHFHPIVHAADPERVFAHECLLRVRGDDGALIYPDRIFAAARAAELLFHVDHAARLTAIREADAHRLETPIFINFNPTAIYDPAFCLRTTVEAARRSGRANSDFVFEVVESDEVGDPDHLLRILDTYRAAGFRVALDDVGAGYASLNLLARLRPDFVKLDRELVRNVHADAYRASVTGKLLEMARELDVRTVAEGVEEVEEWEWLRERGVDFAQGFLFARPASPPPAVRVPRTAAAGIAASDR